MSVNFSFNNNTNKQIISADIVVDVIDELRRERKIKMAIKDANYVKLYIQVDLNKEHPPEGVS